MIVGTRPNERLHAAGRPALVGSQSGDRIQKMLGVELTDRRISTCNLFKVHEVEQVNCEDRARGILARCSLLRHYDRVVFLVNPKRVLPRAEASYFEWYETHGLQVAFSLHPSGLSRWWNDHDNRQAALKFWHDLGSLVVS